jgi:hypothetical protein
VLVGEPLYWELVSALPNPRIKWEVYFQHGTPFGPALKSLTAETAFAPVAPTGPDGPIPSPTHHGWSPSVVATTAGDHKYGARAQDAKTEQALADDDPLLIILP